MAFFKNKKEDPDIVNIPLDNLDVDIDEIQIIDEFYDTKSNKLKSYTGPVVLTVIIGLLIFGLIYFLVNYKIVEGNVIGADFKVGPVSIVDTDYDPNNYLQVGKEIYYNGNTNMPFVARSMCEQNVISKINEERVFVPGKVKDIVVSKQDINYVLEKE